MQIALRKRNLDPEFVELLQDGSMQVMLCWQSLVQTCQEQSGLQVQGAVPKLFKKCCWFGVF